MQYRVKVIIAVAFAAAAAFVGLIEPALVVKPVLAKPAFMDRYNRDPYSRAALRGKCTICHLGHGGGERNDFGEAFEEAGYRITPKLRAKFAELFEKTEPGNGQVR